MSQMSPIQAIIGSGDGREVSGKCSAFLYEKRGNQRAPPMPKIDYTERVEIVSYDDGWPEYEEQVYDF